MNFVKFSIVVALSGILFVGCKNTSSEPTSEDSTQTKTVTDKTKKTAAKLETTSFTIEGMTCAIGCAKTIEKKLATLEGVHKATVDFDNKKATVEFDANIQSPESLAKVVEATADGKTYKVTNIKS